MLPIQNFHQIKVLHVTAQVGSFTEASHVLGCSQSAVSQSIKQIEGRLGFKVFERTGRGIELTPSGRRFIATLQTSWSQIEKSAIAEKRSSNVRTARLCAPPSFTLNWLQPRMAAFYEEHDDIHVELETKENLFHSNESEADVVISYWDYDRPAFLEDDLFPVCSPGFLQKHGLEVGQKEDGLGRVLQDLPLIGEALFPFGTRLDAWTYWAQRFDIDLRNVAMRRHALSSISLKEAEDGLGIAMARSTLVEAQMRAGTLVCLSRSRIKSPYRFFVQRRTLSSESEALEQWLSCVTRQS